VIGESHIGSCHLKLFFIVDTARLHLPGEIVPVTHKKAARPPRPAATRGPGEGAGGAYRAPRGDRDDYRKKESGAPGEFRPQFAGVGRSTPRE
jgi:small subunit ribosomal protein S10e